jgi:hypothetical protein
MYNPIQNGSSVFIKPVPDEKPVECYIPPVGYIQDETGKLIKIGVARRSNIFADCYWEVDKRWSLYKQWKAEEDSFKKGNPDFQHSELTKFINDCWRYRLGGFWFYNNDEPTYITGHYWYYLSVYYMETGKLPEYRNSDKLFFYFWQYCKECPHSYGMLYLTMRRQGKCLSYNTPIRMYDGSLKMVQDIVEGDVVMGVNSQPRKAFGITSGREEMYEIVPRKGQKFGCNGSHILSLIFNGTSNNKWQKDQIVNISVNDYFNLTDSEKDHLVLYRKGWDVEQEDKPHYIHPYILGCWLGDGSRTSGHMTIVDKEIKNSFEEYANSIDHKFNNFNKFTYSITPHKQGENKNKWVQELKRLGILLEKDIPREYITDGRNNRLQILAGIIDTDGYGTKGKKGEISHYEVIQKSKKVAGGIIEIARSLGFYTKVSEKIAVLKREGKVDYNCLVYRIYIAGNLWEIPCRVKRKITAERKTRFNTGRSGFIINSIGEGDYYGFAVDGDHLFLLEDGIVTHNSSKAGAIALDMTSSNASYNSGIQSKTDDDAKSLFRKNIIAPYRKFPYFFQVAKSNIATNGKVPEKELRFIGNKSDEIDDELDSKVDFKPSLAVAYDGSRLGFYIADEVGKPQNVDINQRWDIVQFCLRDFDGSIIGKTIHTTTVEDMGGAAEKLMNMWQNSDVHSITEEKKQTGTGMFRFFLPAQESLDVDKYGNPLVEQSMQKILSERKAKENDSRALASVIRKMPTTIKEAFQSDSENCAFNPIILTKREDELKWTNDGLYETGNFYWEDEEEFGKVKFVENPNGRFKIAYHPDESIRNAHILKFGTRMPLNNAEFAAGVDTFDHKLKEGVMSKGAIVVIKKTSPMHPSLLDEGVACMYKHRPENPEDFYMDVVKCLLYYGCEALIEVNKPALQYFLDKKGLEHYSALLPSKNQRGISASTQSNSYLADITDQYINNYCDKVNFIDLIQEWKAFDVGNTTKSDVAMAFGYARMLCKVKEEKLQNKAKITNIKQIISWYKN